MNLRRRVLVASAALTLVLAACTPPRETPKGDQSPTPSLLPSPTVSEVETETWNSDVDYVIGLAFDDKGDPWYSGSFSGEIGHLLRPSMTAETFAIPGAYLQIPKWVDTNEKRMLEKHPGDIALGSDGAMWFALDGGIGRIDSDGDVTEFDAGVDSPRDLALGPDGNVWYTGWTTRQIGRISTSGEVDVFDAKVEEPLGISPGSDGAMWFAGQRRIGRITMAGHVTTFDAQVEAGSHIAVGPDGNVWYTGVGSDEIARITPTGQVVTFPALVEAPDWISPDGTGRICYFSIAGAGVDSMVACMSPDGVRVGVGVLPEKNATDLTLADDGRLWFTAGRGATNVVGAFDPAQVPG